jgi:Uma2 family endonuclease
MRSPLFTVRIFPFRPSAEGDSLPKSEETTMPTTTLYTADDLAQMPDDDDHRYELIRGHLVVREPSPGLTHGFVATRLNTALAHYVLTHKLGECFAPETGFKFESDPDTVRGPDGAFVRADRIPEQLNAPYGNVAPDLVIEVRSPSNRLRELAEKVDLYLRTGVRMVWLVEPKQRILTVHEPGKAPVQLGPDDILDGGDVVPGFRFAIAELFTSPFG